MIRRMLHGVVAAALGVAALGAHAADPVGVELNKLEPRDGGCRIYLVLENPGPRALEKLKLDLVMFDGKGVIQERLAVDVAPLEAGQTSVKVFGVDGLRCGEVGKVLLNDIMRCAVAGGGNGTCAAGVRVGSKAGIPFIQ